jgi:sortase A
MIGAIGRAFVAVGMLLFGFAGYQVWGTGIQEARAQSKRAAEFDRSATLASASSSTAAPTTTAPVSANPNAGTTSTTEAEATTTAVDDPNLAPAARAKDGDSIARIEIPSIDVKEIVVSGVTVEDLRDGPGHFRNTVLPGQRANAAIAAHRTGYGGPFGDLDKLKPGDKIVVSYKNGDRYVYSVRDSRVVPPTDVSVLDPSDEAILPLATCTPKTTSINRLIVTSVLDEVETTSPVRVATPPSSEPALTELRPGQFDIGQSRRATHEADHRAG